MSLKEPIEDKAGASPLPRSIPQLRSLMNELKAAIKSERKGALVALVEELQTARRKVYAEMIDASRVGASSATIEAYSGVCNEALDVYGQAQSMVSGLGSVR